VSYFHSHFVSPIGEIILPPYDPSHSYDAGGYRGNAVNLPGGGVYRPSGTSKRARGSRELSCKGKYIETSPATIEAYYHGIMAAEDTVGRLYRENEQNTLIQWITAELATNPNPRTPQDIYRYRGYWVFEVELKFTVLDRTWSGERRGAASPALGSGMVFGDTSALGDTAEQWTLAAGANSITLPNDGDAEVRRIKATIIAGSASVTAIRFQSNVIDMTWAGSVASGQVLVIDTGLDTGLPTVTNNGADAYAGLTLNPAHAWDGWLAVGTGGTVFTVTLTGGGTGTLLRTDYFDQYF
jgi:hypothetical protein